MPDSALPGRVQMVQFLRWGRGDPVSGKAIGEKVDTAKLTKP